MCQQWTSDSVFLTTRQQPGSNQSNAVVLPGDASAAVLNGCFVFCVGSACMQQWGGDLRDGVLCEGQILHQHVQAFVIFVQELSHPPGDTKTSLITQEHFEKSRNVFEKHLKAPSMP